MDQSALPSLFARLFIARPDVKAIQWGDGAYMPDVYERNADPTVYLPWSKQAIFDHINGVHTYGHYLLDKDNTCKLFAFDVDLNEEGVLPTQEMPVDEEDAINWEDSFSVCNPREVWKDRKHPARDYLKFCMRDIAHVLQRGIDNLGIPSAVAYTGNKGVHVYGFTGRMPATEVRVAASLAMEELPIIPARGKAFFKWDPSDSKPERDIFTIEVFPKQDSISASGGFGNLMRLPLGVNLKSPKDPTFFLPDQPGAQFFRPTDPVELLTAVAERLKV